MNTRNKYITNGLHNERNNERTN